MHCYHYCTWYIIISSHTVSLIFGDHKTHKHRMHVSIYFNSIVCANLLKKPRSFIIDVVGDVVVEDLRTVLLKRYIIDIFTISAHRKELFHLHNSSTIQR